MYLFPKFVQIVCFPLLLVKSFRSSFFITGQSVCVRRGVTKQRSVIVVFAMLCYISSDTVRFLRVMCRSVYFILPFLSCCLRPQLQSVYHFIFVWTNRSLELNWVALYNIQPASHDCGSSVKTDTPSFKFANPDVMMF